jgi:hypothetical protein
MFGVWSWVGVLFALRPPLSGSLRPLLFTDRKAIEAKGIAFFIPV